MIDEHSQDNQHLPAFRFCPHCGGQLEHKRLKKTEPERRVCSTCNFIFYEDPKIAACTIPVVDNKVVLLKRGIEPSYGKWVFPGGFMDRGERVEEAAIRETWEEANLKVEIERLLNVYSYPGQPTVIIVYLVNVVGGQLRAMDETLEVATFAPDEIPWSELAFDSTGEALRDYLATLTAM
jgi:ADP-ribose pyrophosphatase YjhB (NUDIX family)